MLLNRRIALGTWLLLRTRLLSDTLLHLLSPTFLSPSTFPYFVLLFYSKGAYKNDTTDLLGKCLKSNNNAVNIIEHHWIVFLNPPVFLVLVYKYYISPVLLRILILILSYSFTWVNWKAC